MEPNDPNDGAIREGEPPYFGNATPRPDKRPNDGKGATIWRLSYLAVLGAALMLLAAFFFFDEIQDGFVGPAPTVQLSAEQMDIYEAVLRHQIFNSAAGGRGTSVAFVKILGKDPPIEFIERFRGHHPAVEPLSKYKRARVPKVQYILNEIKRNGESATVEGGYFEGDLSSSGNTYHMSLKNRKWTVVKDEMHWIS